ncbi:MAG: GumC family protein [Rhizomicrobium sp.]
MSHPGDRRATAMTVQRSIPPLSASLLGIPDRPAGGEGLDINAILRTIRTRYRIIAGTALAVVALTVVMVFNITPMYDAHALILIADRENKVADQDAVVSDLDTDPTSIENQLEILRSRDLMLRVIDKMGLDKKPMPASRPSLIAQIKHDINPLNWTAPPSEPQTASQAKQQQREALVNGLLGAETVTSVGRSSALQVAFRSASPQNAADTANAIANAYVEEQLNAKFQATQKTSQWLADRLDKLSSQMQAVDAAVQEYKAQNNITEMPNGGSVLDQQVAQLNTQLVIARSNLAEAQAKYAQARQLQASGRAEDLSQIFQSGMIEQLRTQQTQLLRQKAQYMTIYGPRHPKMLDLESQIKDVDQKIGEEVNRVVATVASDVAVADAHVQSLQTSLDKLEAAAAGQSKAEVKLSELQARSTSAHQLYEAFLAKFKETQGQEGIQTPDSRVISRANAPSTPAIPNKTRDIEMAMAGGLLLGFLVAIGLERLDNGITTVQQLEDVVGIPVLSTIPELAGMSRGERAEDRVIDKPLSVFSEAVRGLQMALVHSNLDRKPKLILITSSIPDEGKTTVALSLARTFARADKKVLLVDCDLRRPNVAKALGFGGPTNGLLNVLSGEKSLEESLTKDPRSSVKCLLTARIPTTPTEVLGSAAMARLLERLRTAYDVVILDSAPILPVNDTKVLVGAVDTIAFAVRWEKTRKDAVAAAVKALRDISAPVAGAVITRADVKRYRYYNYGEQSSYAKYYTE